MMIAYGCVLVVVLTTRGSLIWQADLSPMMIAYGCKEQYFRPFDPSGCTGGKPRWQLTHFLHDAFHLVLVSTMVVAFGAAVPRARSRLSDAGEHTLYCYLLHVPLTPLIQCSSAVATLHLVSAEPKALTRALLLLLRIIRTPRLAVF